MVERGPDPFLPLLKIRNPKFATQPGIIFPEHQIRQKSLGFAIIWQFQHGKPFTSGSISKPYPFQLHQKIKKPFSVHFWLDITEVFETKWDINISPISSATLDSWSSWSDPVHIPGARSQPPLFWQESLNPWPVGLVFSTGRGGPVGILPTWDLLRVLRGRRRPTTPNPPTCPKHRD